MANITLKNVNKIYKGGVHAVKDFSMDIEEGEFIVFVGPSGCGKSTTLRMIAGLEEISEGELYINDVYANDLEPKDRNLAMVFQNYALYPYLTVYENIAFGLRLRHFKKDEIDEKVRAAAETFGLSDLLQRKPKALSGGQRQRVALARAVVREAEAYLLDEPLSNLDAKLRTAMRVEITKLFEKLKKTFIYVTHDQVEAMTMGTRIVVMKEGVVQQIDTPIKLYDHPQNLFVAGFIGTPQMNFFDGKLTTNTRNANIDFGPKCNIKIPLSKLYTNETIDVVVGFRSEDISFASEKDGYKAKVVMIETLGSESLVYLSWPNKEATIDNSSEFIMKIQGRCSYKNGDIVYINFNKDKIHLFNKENQNSILNFENLDVESSK